MKYLTLIFLVCFGLFSGGCATQQDVLILDDRLSALEQMNSDSLKKGAQLTSRMEIFGKDRNKKEAHLRDQIAELHAQLSRLRKQVQKMTGQIEETTICWTLK